MIQKLSLTALLILAIAGCGAGNAADDGAAKSGDQGAAVAAAPGGRGSAEKPAAATPAETPAKAEAATSDADEAGSEQASTPHPKPAVDTSQLQPAPGWVLTDLSGKPVDFSQYKGQVVLIDFWATWCGPCRMSIPHLKELYSEYKDDGFTVIGVSLDQQGPGVVRPFVAQQKIEYPIVMGNQQIVQDFGGIRGIPTAFVISQDGKIYRKYVGLRPRQTYEKDIRDLLGLTS